jgi:hypothetical protein
MRFLKGSLLALSVVAAAFTFQAPKANAGLILVEPHLNYNVWGGSTTTITSTNSTQEIKYSGPQYGLKLGAQYLGFMGGFIVNQSSFTWRITNTYNSTPNLNSATDYKFDRTEVGIFGGYNLPILFRGWAAYYFSNKAENKDTAYLNMNSLTGVKYTGHTIEIGVGYKGLPFVSINAIYRNVSHDEIEYPTSNTKYPTSVSNDEFVLGVSAPFSVL